MKKKISCTSYTTFHNVQEMKNFTQSKKIKKGNFIFKIGCNKKCIDINVKFCVCTGGGQQRVRANLYGALLYYLQIAQKPKSLTHSDPGNKPPSP